MYGFFKSTDQRLRAQTQTATKRYLYDHFTPSGRLTGIVGPRGVGKTTLMLQYIQEHHADDPHVIYLSVDNIFFKQCTLLEFIDQGYRHEGMRIFFLDEIHKYPDWNQELKNIYDAYPDISIIFSGSSSIDLVKGSYDLSRRADLYHLSGLSFREFLCFKTGNHYPSLPLESILENPAQYDNFLTQIPDIERHFSEYLKSGYYPFYFENHEAFQSRLLRVIEKNIQEDVAGFYQLKTQNLIYFSKILHFLADIPPGELNTNRLAQNMNLDNKTVQHYMTILSEIGLIHLVSANMHGNAQLRKPQKAFIQNTTLLQTLCDATSRAVDLGMQREVFFLQAINNISSAYYAKQGDFILQDYHLEIGGKNKTQAQIKNLKGYLIKDGTLVSTSGIIPLILFGFIY